MSYIGKTASSATQNIFKFVPSSSATTVTGADAFGRVLSMPSNQDAVSVFLNGILLLGRGVDYSLSTSTVTFTSAYAISDEIIIITLEPFAVADHLKKSTGGTVEGGLTVNGAFTSKGIDDNADATSITIDSSENVGIKTVTPTNYYADDLVVTAPDEGGMTIVSGTAERTYLAFADGTSGDARYRGLISYDHNTDIFGIGAGGGTKIELDSTSNLGVGRSINAHSGYTNVAIGGSGSTTGSMIELFDSDGNRDGKVYAKESDLYVSGEDRLYLNGAGTAGIVVESDGQTTISKFNETAGNNHALLTISYHLSSSIGGFQMYTYSYYNDINFRIQNNDTHGGRNHNDMAFIRSGATRGSISIHTGSTSFNTTSDYRMKKDEKPITNAIDTVKKLKPYNFNWKDSGINEDGFFAHEVDEVLDYVVTGKKDAVKTYENVVLNKDGFMVDSDVTKEQYEKRIDDKDNEDGSPIGETTYPEGSTWKETHEDVEAQQMDTSKLVPMLTACLQEAIAKIETLETKVKALEEA